MSPLWAIPAVVLLIGATAVYALARAAVEEARELGKEVARFGDVRPALVSLRSEVEAARRSVEARARR